jgi:hypothetical protein
LPDRLTLPGYALPSAFPAEWVRKKGGLFSGEALGLQRKSPGLETRASYSTKQEEVRLPMLTLWLKIVTVMITVRMKLTIRKGR